MTVQSPSGPVFVVVDGAPAGSTPVELNLDGPHVLGFRSSAFGADLFTERVEVHEALVVEVDLARRVASIRSGPTAPERAAAASASGGELYVQSEPPGAAILLDGHDTGLVTPAMVRGVPAGEHEVVVRTDCARAEGVATVQADRIARLDALQLVEGDAVLRVEVEPAEATVYVDGIEAGPPPFEARVACGAHVVEARAPEHIAQATDAYTEAYRRSTWSFHLRSEAYGTLVVDVDPLTAVVCLDGVEMEPGPTTIEQVAAGLHSLQVRADGRQAHAEDVTVAADEVTRVRVELPPVAVERVGGGGPSGLRIGANVGLTAAALGAGGVALGEYLSARAAYDEYLAVPDDAAAAEIWDTRVAPRSAAAWAAGIAGGVLAVGSGALWVTTDFGATPTGRVAVGGRW